MQRVLLKESAAQLTGRFRNEQVWVGGTGYSPHGASHIAPHHSRIPAAIDDLVQFTERQDLGGLTHIAVAHAQFETIYPSSDGNGRPGETLSRGCCETPDSLDAYCCLYLLGHL